MVDKPFLGGGQKNLLSLAESLEKSRFDVSVCSQADGPLVNAVQKRNIRHFPVTFSKRFDRKIIRKIEAVLRENRIDILHTHGGVAGFYGRWAARSCRVPVVIHTLHGIHYLHYRNIFLKYAYVLLERRFSKFTDALVFVSEGDLKRGKKFELAPEEKMVVVKNGIDFKAYADKVKGICREMYAQEMMKFGPDDVVVGTVARLHRQKGIPTLLRAAQIVRQAVPRVKFVIAGGGPLKQRLEKFNVKLGNQDFVQILGEREDAPELLGLCDVFVLSSLWEGLPYVLMEAAALSKPVVATDVEGTRELIISGQTGILVPSQSPEALAKGVIFLLQNKKLAVQQGRKLQEDLSARYSLSGMVREMQTLYSDLFKMKTEVG